MDMDESRIRHWKKEEKAPFQGWDFSYIEGRYREDKPDWDYISLAKRYIRKSDSVLDMATGGGEVFTQILQNRKPVKIIAIEGYKPNVSVARKNLKGSGVKVIYANETKKLPFEDGEFDLVLNRHGGPNVKEIGRILRPNGIFLTQQVDGRTLKDLMKLFGARPKWEFNTLHHLTAQLAGACFEIELEKEWRGKVHFFDVGALVYFLKAIPWLIDDFSVDNHSDILEKLHAKLERSGELTFDIRRFIVIAHKIDRKKSILNRRKR